MDLRTILHAAGELAGSLAPSLIGSAIAQAWKPGLPWRDRFLQWVVGSTVSYYATSAIIAATGWNDFVAQSIAFGIAIVAFDATPALKNALIETLSGVPARIADRFLGRKDKAP